MERSWEALSKSLWIYHWNSGSCNGCDGEWLSSFGPRYDLERLGVRCVESPRQADLLLVTGAVCSCQVDLLRRTYAMMAEPRLVMAFGVCAVSGGIFRDSPVGCGPLDAILPVDVYVLGCPPRPEALVEGLTRVVLEVERRCALSERRRSL
ncbi:NADH-quinone oxidoreductase subunit NuoB [Aminithiophilus ramosus]|uniref:NADH-quinone oxidoreductase subunit NuoB n=2 Tax=Synergistales TaxID=649776 RepID=A0A9Q7AD73_9BACT|nr:NADH-quinone oxidoreductase subunit NuoB [Aminithiophilus ramosus]QTX31324.1 NADH-quinone oxidoreductase subunit NuoB [Aminithiophilus ramosus]QVL35123.1 NADH-quinone oxidoreductase subunit NuoB [Synergistota bacterium]